MKTVCKLFVKCICVIFPLIAMCVYIAAHPLSYLDEEGPYYIWNKNVANTQQQPRYDTIILGDSIANSDFVPELLSPSTINLSLGGTTPMENYYILSDWLTSNPAPKACYIAFNEFHFNIDDCFWTRSLYTHRFSLRQNLEMFRNAIACNDSYLVTDNYLFDFLSYELYLPNKYIAAFMNAGINQRSESNDAALCMNTLHKGHYLIGVNEYFAPQNILLNSFAVSPLNDMYYRKLLDLLLANHIATHIIILPFPDNCVFSPEYEASITAYFQNLQDLYPELTVTRCGLMDEKMFADTRHMNMHGSLHFSRGLKELFPQDFGDYTLTAEQAAGIDDYINREPSLEKLPNWIEGFDYSILIADAQGSFVTQYQNQEAGTAMPLRPFTVEGENAPQLYVLSGLAKEDDGFSVSYTADGTFICLPGKEPQKWDISSERAIHVAVIDHYNGLVACMKSFRCNNSAFIPV